MTNQKINEEFIFINPKEIYEFVSNSDNFIELINIIFIQIKTFFPNSKIYLEFVEDPEDEEGDCIVASIFNPSVDYKRNCEIFNDFYDDFSDTLSSFNNLEYYFNVISGDKYYREILGKEENVVI
ncbi:MAG: hypothetical protein IKV87_07620 [Methanobrevibacter sp.]|nr:hypothetical protein [Methanobrevibacter sp.]